MVTDEKIVTQKAAAWYDRNYEPNDSILSVVKEAGMLVGMAGFFAAMLGFSHLVGLYERLRRWR